MLQSYKLRLGDGTILLVDHDGLSSWVGDCKALVQPVGSDLWRPLKGFLAQECAAARRAERLKPKPPSTSRDALPLVYPKPRKETRSGPPATKPIPPRADGLRLNPPTVKPRDDPDRARRSPVPASPATVVRPSLPKAPPPAPVLPRPPAGPLLSPTPILPSPPLIASPPIVTSPSIVPSPPMIPSPPSPLSPKPRDDRNKRPSDEDVEWMTVPLEPLSASAPPSLFQEARLELSRLPSAVQTLVTDGIDSLARRDWHATQLWLMSQAASVHAALLAPWKSPPRTDRPLPSFSSGAPVPSLAVESRHNGARVLAEKRTESVVYSPRRSAEDGLPILQLEALDEQEGSNDDLPEIILEPLDDEVATGAPSNRWTKRLVLIGSLVVGGLLVTLSFNTWFPKAAPFGRTAPSEVLRLEQSSDQVERQRQSLQEASQKLPHLAPATIWLVLVRSATGVLDPPALFRVTYAAADRGSWMLSPAEQQELRALRRELLDTLLPHEAEHILEYDDARARRATFPFEDRAALDLFARGANALPSRRRARLQVLLGKAVAAQLRADSAR